MSSAKSRNLCCRVNPLVVASISDSYVRRQEGNQKCIGTLMGYVDGNTLVISDAFMVLHKENEDMGTLSIDKEYHRKMVLLKKKVCPAESVVGWFSTCDEMEAGFVAVQSFYATTNESKFIASPIVPAPVLLTMDPSMSSGDLNIKVSIMQMTVGAESLMQFHQLPVSFEEAPLDYLAGFSEMPLGKLIGGSLKEDLRTLAEASAVCSDVAMAIQSLNVEFETVNESKAALLSRVEALVSTDSEILI